MKRRQALQALLGAPAIAALPSPAAAQTPPAQTGRPAGQIENLETVPGDAVASGVTNYFSPPQLGALRKLGDLLMPGGENRPSASQAEAPEFLDFLISQSPPDRQTLYREGLDRLQAEARRRYRAPFEELTAQQADAILVPLHQPWTYQAPPDPLAHFLRDAKDDLIAATLNSRAFAAAQPAGSRLRNRTGTYWYPVE
jgi:hypothetical protein